MTRRHNIVGCEATERHRLIAFSHAHGVMAWGERRARRIPHPVLTFFAGAAAGLAAAVAAKHLG